MIRRNLEILLKKIHIVVDLLIENGQNLLAIEINAARTYNQDNASHINTFLVISNTRRGLVPYAGEQAFRLNSLFPAILWYVL